MKTPMYNITALRRIYETNNPYHLQYSFTQLANFLKIPRKGIKTDKKCTIPAWSPALFDGNGTRNENVLQVSCMVFDIDDGLQFEEHHVFHSFQYIAYTSPSHSVLNHRWRLVIPLDEPIPAKYWGAVWESMIQVFEKKTNSLYNGGKVLDKSCKDARRFYFLGKENKQFEYYINETGLTFWVNQEQIIKKQKEQQRKREEFLKEQRKRLIQLENRPIRNRDSTQEMRMNLNLKSDYRRILAERLGAKITGGSNPRAVGWECPQCHRNDCTFFYIYPENNKLSAFCNHRNSCGMVLSLFELGRIRGVF